MEVNGKNLNLNAFLTNGLIDHRASNTPRNVKPKEWINPPVKRTIKAINGVARFKLIIWFKNNSKKEIWIPSLDLYQGLNGNYYKDEKTAYEKLIWRINNPYFTKFNFCYISMCLDNNPLWNDNNYNFCVYANYRGFERNYFKQEKIYTFEWKKVTLPNGQITYILDRSKFLDKYRIEKDNKKKCEPI